MAQDAEQKQVCDELAFELEQHLDSQELVMDGHHRATTRCISEFLQANHYEVMDRLRKVVD